MTEILSIQKLIDDSLAIENSEPRTSSGKYNPSLLGQCHRKHFWKRKGDIPSEPIDKLSLRRFKCGNIFEWFAVNLIPSAQKQVKIETSDFLGFADVVTDTEVMDIKSINSKAFWYMDKPTYNVNESKWHNILQTAFYAKELGKEKFRLVFISKDDLSIREYGFALSAWMDALDTEISSLKEAWDTDSLPDAEPMAKWECGFCQFAEHCKKTGGAVWNEKETKGEKK